MTRAVYISVGSNIDPEINVRSALRHLKENGFRIASVSTHYRTLPVKHREYPPYINGVWQLESCLSPDNLNQKLTEIEKILGRKRELDRYASRTIDLDVLIDPAVSGFHRDVLIRNFVYLPLLELGGNLRLSDGSMLADKVNASDTRGITPLYEYTNQLRSMINE